MKKAGILFIIFFSFFVGIVNVNAAEALKKISKQAETPNSENTCIYSFVYHDKHYDYYMTNMGNDYYARNMWGTFTLMTAYEVGTQNSKDVISLRFQSAKYKYSCPDLYYIPSYLEADPMSPDFYDTPDGTTSYLCAVKLDGTGYEWTSSKIRNDQNVYQILPDVLTKEQCDYVAGDIDPNKPEMEYDIVSCGNGFIKNIPHKLVKMIKLIITIIHIGVPILLIIFGMIDLAKGVIGQKEDEIAKGQKIFIKRLITALLVFIVIFAVKISVRFVSENSESIISCLDCFMNDTCEGVQ